MRLSPDKKSEQKNIEVHVEVAAPLDAVLAHPAHEPAPGSLVFCFQNFAPPHLEPASCRANSSAAATMAASVIVSGLSRSAASFAWSCLNLMSSRRR